MAEQGVVELTIAGEAWRLEAREGPVTDANGRPCVVAVYPAVRTIAWDVDHDRTEALVRETARAVCRAWSRAAAARRRSGRRTTR